MVRQQFGPLKTASTNVLANPQDTYVQPHNIGPNTPAEFDLAPLSKTLTTFMNEKSARDGVKAEADGYKRFMDLTPEQKEDLATQSGTTRDPEKAHKKLISSFGKLIAKGEIPEMASPFAQRGFARASAGQMMTRFHNGAMRRIGEATSLTDEDGTPQAAMSPQEIIDEEWAKVQGNAALNTTEGKMIASERFASTEREFMGRTVSGLAEEQRRLARGMLEDNVFQGVLELTATDAANPTSLSPLNKILSDAAEANMQGIPAAMVSGINAAVLEISSSDPDKAEQALDSLRGLMVPNGGKSQKWEDTAQGAIEIARMGRGIDGARDRHERSEDRKVFLQDRNAIREADQVGWGVLFEAHQNGETPAGAVTAAIEAMDLPDNQVGPMTKYLMKQADALGQRDPDPTARRAAEDRIIQNDLTVDDARFMWERGQITPETFHELEAMIAERETRVGWMERNSRFMASATGITDFAEPVGAGGETLARLGRLKADRRLVLEKSMGEYLAGLGREPTDEEHLKFLTDFDAETKTLLEAQSTFLSEQESNALDELEAATESRDTPKAQALLTKHSHLLSREQRKKFRNAIAANDNFDYTVRQHPSYSAHLRLLGGLQAELTDEEGLLPTKVGTILDVADRRFIERAKDFEREVYAANPGNPVAAKAAYTAGINAISDEMIELVKPELKSFREAQETSKDGAVDASRKSDDISQAEFRANALTAARHESSAAVADLLDSGDYVDLTADVAPGLKRSWVSMMSRETKNGDRTVRKAEFETYVTDEMISISTGDLDPDAQRAAISSIVRMSGLSEYDFLHSEITRVYTPAQKEAFALQRDTAGQMLASPVFPDPDPKGRAASATVRGIVQANFDKAQQALDGIISVPLDISAVDPFNTPIGNVREWMNSPARVTAIMDKLGLQESDRQKFIDNQIRAYEGRK